MGPRKRGAATTIPADLVEEILHRLPSHDLVNFKLVCKDWLRLISSPEFIKKHAKSHHPHIVKFSPSEIEILGYCADNLTSKKVDVKGHMLLLGSCDGLLLYFKPLIGEIGALNPSTGEVAVNAPLTKKCGVLGRNSFCIWLYSHSICTWFGRHPATGEYVLVVASLRYPKYGDRSKIIVFRVYGLSHNSLLSLFTEEVERCSSFRCPDIGTFLHGRLHVLRFSLQGHNKPDDILAYDLKTNRMVKMLTPSVKPCLALGVVDGCLCILHQREVWMMKEYGVEGSWTKYVNIDDKITIPIQICPDADVFLCDGFLKVFRDGAMTGVRDCHGIFLKRKVVACVDSLVSPAVVFGTKE